MAIRYRAERKKWQVYWVNPWTGKQQSVQCATEQEAHRTDDQVKFRLKWERDSFKPQAEREENIPDDCIETIYAFYLQEKRFTRKNLREYLLAMKAPLAEFGRRRIGTITRQELAAFIGSRVAEGHGLASLQTCMQRFYAVLRWAEKRGYVDRLPILPDTPRYERQHLVPPSTEELARMIAVAPDHIKRVIIIGSKLGVRVGPSELFAIRWEDFDLETGVLHLRAAKKNKHEPLRDIPVQKSLIPIFKSWMYADTCNGIPWVVHYHGKPITTDIIATWKRMLKAAGITRRIRPYDLRHAFATELIAAGADIGTVAKLMGHANVTMTLNHYQHVMTRQKEAAIETLPDLTEYVQANMPKMSCEIMQ